jgi:UDP-N-acetylmuramyl pentapeptide phosphotransferase/UDP-N-acetylglucosamine-1-phosphate transferase
VGCLYYFDYAIGWFFVFLVISSMWWVNLFNFMDGANGMAGLHVVVITLFYSYIFLPTGNYIDSILLSVLAVILVYLFFNIYLKKIFMGDSGSLPLALLLVVLALTALQEGRISYWQIAIIHGAFIVDATMTLIWRFFKKQNITQAHALHLYQRLIKAKHSHLKVSASYALLTVLLCCVALFMSGFNYYLQIIILLATYLILVVVFMKNLSTGR